ncbi:MAG: phage virion morphogenesis protein [Psychromonas sp.]
MKFDFLELEKPEQLTQLLNGLILTASESFDLNRRMANHTRKFFRGQIRKQRDINNNPYQGRTRRKIERVYKRGAFEDTKLTQNNKNMMLGFSRALRTYVNEKGFEVGLRGLVGHIATVHNEGKSVSFTTHVNGFYNSKTSRWEGGSTVKRNYTMPKRTIIGWTPTLERELLAMVADSIVNSEEH